MVDGVTIFGILSGLLVAVVPLLSFLGGTWYNKRRLDLEKSNVAIASVEILLNPLKEKIEAQSREISKLEATIKEWEIMHKQREAQHAKEVGALKKRIKELEACVKKPVEDR